MPARNVNRIKQLRKERRVSVAVLAQALDISSQYLYELERGDKRLNEDILRKLAEYFQVSVDYILGLSPDPIPLKDKMLDPGYVPVEYDLERLLEMANIRFKGERMATSNKESLLQIARILWEERRNLEKKI